MPALNALMTVAYAFLQGMYDVRCLKRVAIKLTRLHFYGRPSFNDKSRILYLKVSKMAPKEPGGGIVVEEATVARSRSSNEVCAPKIGGSARASDLRHNQLLSNRVT